MELDVSVSDRGDRTVVSVVGEIDAYTAPKLEAALAGPLDAEAPRLVVDLSAVEFLDSTGLGVLVAGLNRASNRGGGLELVVTNVRVRRIFEISSLTELFRLHDSVDAALDGA